MQSPRQPEAEQCGAAAGVGESRCHRRWRRWHQRRQSPANPKPGRSKSQDTAWEGDRKASADPFDRFDSILAQLVGGAAPPQRWPKRALFAACVAVLAAGWWFYRDDAGHRSETTIPPALAGEIPASPNQA